MNEIRIYLKTSGSLAELYKDFNLYAGSYQNVLISIYVPKALLWSDLDNTFTNTVKTGAILTAENGARITTKGYYANYVKDEVIDGVTYSVFSQTMPREYAVYVGTQTIIVNVAGIDNSDPVAPKVIQVTTSQTASLIVLQSAYLSDTDIIDPSELDIINGRLTALEECCEGVQTGDLTAGKAKYYEEADGSKSTKTIAEEFADLPQVLPNPDGTGIDDLVKVSFDGVVYNVPNMEISFGNEPDPTAFPLNTMTINGDTFRFVGEKGDPRYPSNQSDITAQTGTDTYISPSEVAFSVKTGLIAPGKANWTDEEKATARATLGINTNTDLLNLIYPIGSVYMSFNNVSPATFFGGTWEQIKDTFLLAVGDTYTAGQSGGEATHKLIINEMPNHAHKEVLAYEQTGYGVTIKPGETYALSGLITSPDYLATNPPDGQPLTNRNERLLHETASVGNSKPHNNMPPYQTVYMWKRTA